MLKLQAVELSKSYRGRKVVDDVELEIGQGEVVGLLGPNGAGKTTTFYILVGLARPDSGRVLLNGEEITDLPMYLRARSGISYLPQEPSVFRQLTSEENLLAVLETLPLTPEQQRDRLEELLAQMGLETVRTSKAYMLSGGERRRLEIARSLTLEPSFILLDEPFSGIDPLTVKDLQETIRGLAQSGIGVLITDHNVRETLTVTDRAYILKSGKIFRKGRPEDLSNDPEVRRVYLGDHFRLNCSRLTAGRKDFLDHGLARTQTQLTGGAEADSDAWSGADGQRAGAEPPGVAGDDQHRDGGQSGAGRVERRADHHQQLQRRKLPEERNRESPREKGAERFRRIRRRQLFQPVPGHRWRRRAVPGTRNF